MSGKSGRINSSPTLRARYSRRGMLRLLSGVAAAAVPFAAAKATEAGGLGGAQPFHSVVPGIAADGVVPPPPPPPPPPADDRWVAPQVFYHGDRAGDRIYLTFDDCYSAPLVAQAMDIAENGGARLTFFPVGTVLGQHPDLWRDVLGRGHAIENHTWDHPDLSKLSDTDIWSEMAHQMEALRDVVGSDYTEQFIRPPYGAGIFNYQQRIPDIAASLGLKVCMWSADSNGWRLAPREDQAAIDTIVSNAMKDFQAGSIVLQHVIGNDVAALPTLVDQANRLGLKAVTLRAGIK